MSLLLPVYLSEEGDEEALSKKEEEERRIAEMGRPTLGEHVKLEVVIEESYEFKVLLVWLGSGEKERKKERKSRTASYSLLKQKSS